jgi:hypothetical protein
MPRAKIHHTKDALKQANQEKAARYYRRCVTEYPPLAFSRLDHLGIGTKSCRSPKNKETRLKDKRILICTWLILSNVDKVSTTKCSIERLRRKRIKKWNDDQKDLAGVIEDQLRILQRVRQDSTNKGLTKVTLWLVSRCSTILWFGFLEVSPVHGWILSTIDIYRLVDTRAHVVPLRP